MRASVWLLLAAVVLTGATVAALVATGPDGDQPEGPRERPFATTALEDVDTAALVVRREGFCDDVDPREVEAALGSEPAEVTGYDNGEEVALGDGVTDVAHEFGCAWVAPDRSAARAWVFAPPVDRRRADDLLAGARRTEGCQASTSPAFGTPSLALLCEDGTASYRGLFGDAWLTCELQPAPTADAVTADELRARAGSWCVAVARAAS